MITKSNSLVYYQDYFSKKGIELKMLQRGQEEIETMANILIAIESHFLFPTEDKTRLYEYATKLVNHAYNFVLLDEARHPIGVVSIYANDRVTKTAFTSTIGIIPTYRGGNMIRYLVKLALDFAKDAGMEKYRAEVHQVNEKWLHFLIGKFGFQIEGATTDGTYLIVKEL